MIFYIYFYFHLLLGDRHKTEKSQNHYRRTVNPQQGKL